MNIIKKSFVLENNEQIPIDIIYQDNNQYIYIKHNLDGIDEFVLEIQNVNSDTALQVYQKSLVQYKIHLDSNYGYYTEKISNNSFYCHGVINDDCATKLTLISHNELEHMVSKNQVCLISIITSKKNLLLEIKELLLNNSLNIRQRPHIDLSDLLNNKNYYFINCYELKNNNNLYYLLQIVNFEQKSNQNVYKYFIYKSNNERTPTMNKKITIEDIFKNQDLLSKIEDETCWRYDDVNNIFIYNIYADYRDVISDYTLKELFQNGDYELGSFEEKMFDWYSDIESDYLFELCDIISQYYGIKNSEIMYIIEDYISINYPYDYYLSQKLQVTLQVNPKKEYWNCNMEKNISLKWLLKSQGYNNWKNINKSNSKFATEIIIERDNTYLYGLPTFLVTMTLGQLIEYYETRPILKIKAKDIQLCGIVDTIDGSGGLFIQNLEKDILLQPNDIYAIAPDCAVKNYGVDSIFGLIPSCWDTSVEFIKGGGTNEEN